MAGSKNFAISASVMRACFEAAHGRGWQKSLAKRINVAESTISQWSREGVPAIAQEAVRQAIKEAAAPPSPWVLAHGPVGFEILDMAGALPRIIARDTDPEHAHLIVAAPALFDAAEAALRAIRRESGVSPPDLAAAKELEVALEAAIRQAKGQPTRVAVALATATAAIAGTVTGPFQGILRELRESNNEVAVPGFDPDGGAEDAPVLILAMSPTKADVARGCVSLVGSGPVIERLGRAVAAAGLDRRKIIFWNAVPWVRVSDKPIERSEIEEGISWLRRVLAEMRGLRAAVLLGKVAAEAEPELLARGVETHKLPLWRPSSMDAPRMTELFETVRAGLEREGQNT